MRAIQGRRCIRFAYFGCLSLALLGVFVPTTLSQDNPTSCLGLSPENGPRLATGPTDSSYFRFAIQLKEVNKRTMERWQLCTTKGSQENLRLLNNRQVEFAIVQGDLMHEGWSGERPALANFKNLALVRLLFSEKLHIVTAPHSHVSTVGELRAKHVWLGPNESGTQSTAREVLKAAGVEETHDVTFSNYQEANEAILHGRLDALFRVTAVPIDADREQDQSPDMFQGSLTFLLGRRSEVHLVSLDGALIDRILQSPAYVQVPIYRRTYPGQENGIMTIGLEAMLITRVATSQDESEARAADVQQINDAITDGRRKIANTTNIALDLVKTKLDPKGEGEEQALAWHVYPAAKPVLWINPYTGYYVAGIVALVAMIVALLGFWSKKVMETLGGNTKSIVNLGALAVLCALFGIALWGWEGKFSFDFHNPFQAALSLLVYFARGLKTDTLMTHGGQITALFALDVIATLTHSINSDVLGQVVSKFSKKLSRWFFKRAAEVRPDSRHLVVLNWDKRVSDQMAEWIKIPANAKSKITIVLPDVVGAAGITQTPGVEVLHGDPKSLDMLERASVQDAKLVLISSAWSRMDPFDRRHSMDVEVADNYTIRAIYGIRTQECRSHSKRSAPIEAEIHLENNWRAAKDAGGSETEVKAPQSGFQGFGKPPQDNLGQTPASPPN